MRRLDQEHGATAVFVAIMLAVIFGVSALTIDVGALYFERRQLQNGADAAALALAAICAEEGTAVCAVETLTGELEDAYANPNALDGRSAIPLATTHGLDPALCRPGTDTAPNPLAGSNVVKVSTRTVDAATGDAPFLTNVFATVLDALVGGDGSNNTTTVSACATAAWANVGGGTSIPIALCERAWDYWTDFGATLPSGPPAHVVRFATGRGAPVAAHQDCTNPSYDTYPGAFGFLDRDENCMAVTNENGDFPGTTGNNPVDPDSACTADEMYAMLQDIIDSGETALIPIFDGFTGSGSSGAFHVIGYGAFKLEGYHINAGPGPGVRTYGMFPSECTGGGASCLKGYFTSFVALDAVPSTGTGTGFGATVVYLTG